VEAELRFHILLAIVFPKIGIPSNIGGDSKPTRKWNIFTHSGRNNFEIGIIFDLQTMCHFDVIILYIFFIAQESPDSSYSCILILENAFSDCE